MPATRRKPDPDWSKRQHASFIYDRLRFHPLPPQTAGTSSSTDTHAKIFPPCLFALVPGIALLNAFPTLENGVKEAVTGTYETYAAVESCAAGAAGTALQ